MVLTFYFTVGGNFKGAWDRDSNDDFNIPSPLLPIYLKPQAIKYDDEKRVPNFECFLKMIWNRFSVANIVSFNQVKGTDEVINKKHDVMDLLFSETLSLLEKENTDRNQLLEVELLKTFSLLVYGPGNLVDDVISRVRREKTEIKLNDLAEAHAGIIYMYCLLNNLTITNFKKVNGLKRNGKDLLYNMQASSKLRPMHDFLILHCSQILSIVDKLRKPEREKTPFNKNAWMENFRVAVYLDNFGIMAALNGCPHSRLVTPAPFTNIVYLEDEAHSNSMNKSQIEILNQFLEYGNQRSLNDIVDTNQLFKTFGLFYYDKKNKRKSSDVKSQAIPIIFTELLCFTENYKQLLEKEKGYSYYSQTSVEIRTVGLNFSNVFFDKKLMTGLLIFTSAHAIIVRCDAYIKTVKPKFKTMQFIVNAYTTVALSSNVFEKFQVSVKIRDGEMINIKGPASEETAIVVMRSNSNQFYRVLKSTAEYRK